MDTHPSRPSTSYPRWLRVSIVVSLILLVQGTLAYLLTWIEPAAAPDLEPISINSYADSLPTKPQQIENEPDVSGQRSADNPPIDVPKAPVTPPIIPKGVLAPPVVPNEPVAALLVPGSQELKILVSGNPDEPGTATNEIRIRPGNVKQAHHVYVRNFASRTQTVIVEIRSGDVLVCRSPKLLTVDANETRKVELQDSASIHELQSSLTVYVLDEKRSKVVAAQALPVGILWPHEYVTVADARYDPGRDGNNRWAVAVQASRAVVGPAIAAHLVLPEHRIPGLLGIGGGTLQVELPTQTNTPRLLFAEGLRLAPTVVEEGPVYLHIDGVPRAFVYRTTFSRTGAPNQPRPDHRPAVRLVAASCLQAGVDCRADVEVDNAPPGCKLDVALGRAFEDNSFKADLIHEFTDPKKRRIGLYAAQDALIFEATVGDWTATFETRSLSGARALRARLIDAGGHEIAQARQSLVIDDSPPIARIAPMPGVVRKGTTLPVQSKGVDPESGVAQVVFFLGKPYEGDIPASAARFKAIPANREGTLWSAKLDVPEYHQGPLTVSVRVVNHAGMAAFDSVTIDVADREPNKTGLGEIRGTVVEGPRPQSNLLVTLLDDRGKEIARTRTLDDGTYAFGQVAPGSYRVLCVKPESQRRAVLGVTVEPDCKSRADLSLSL